MESSNNIEPLTVELCYQILADYLIGNAGNDEWDTLVLESEIYDSMTTASAYKIYAKDALKINVLRKNVESFSTHDFYKQKSGVF